MKRSRIALALFLGAASAVASASPPGKSLPFVEDDYPKAVAQARARNVPIFIEAWAPW
jgi:hypothetical protein